MKNEEAFGIRLDRALGIPLRQQIRAALIHRISDGTLRPGAALPSVRDLAETARIAPMTVSKVYDELKEAGLTEARVGSGTFVMPSALTRFAAEGGGAALLAQLDGVIDAAARSGLGAGDIGAMIGARVVSRLAAGPRPGVVMVGLFPAATESYAGCIAAQVGEAATVAPLVLTDGEADASRLKAANLIVTFASLHDRIAALAPGRPIVSIRFIPAESTRMALASLDPMARLAVVSRFADFLPVLELGVRRFAPHVGQVTALDLAAPELEAAVARCDVIVMSTGAEAAGDLAPPGAVRIEYRHIPDPGDVARLVLPRLTAAPLPERTDEREAS